MKKKKIENSILSPFTRRGSAMSRERVAILHYRTHCCATRRYNIALRGLAGHIRRLWSHRDAIISSRLIIAHHRRQSDRFLSSDSPPDTSGSPIPIPATDTRGLPRLYIDLLHRDFAGPAASRSIRRTDRSSVMSVTRSRLFLPILPATEASRVRDLLTRALPRPPRLVCPRVSRSILRRLLSTHAAQYVSANACSPKFLLSPLTWDYVPRRCVHRNITYIVLMLNHL